ncbi:MAG: AMP-binding protein [Myxococcales bacterium]|nr:AMP-binding protein [Myxococcales bacterium]
MSNQESQTFVEHIQRAAARDPDRVIYTVLDDGERAGETLTNGELDRRARAVGATIAPRVRPGDRVLMMYPSGLEFVVALFGCLGAGAVAVPVALPDPSRLNRTLPRLKAIVEDAAPRVVLTTTRVHKQFAPFLDQFPALARILWLTTDDVDPAASEGWSPRQVEPAALAFFQYTSGSTGKPKGVMLTHRNLLHNTGCIARAFAIDARDTSVTWLPNFHDMGLAFGVLIPTYTQGPAFLMSPIEFMRRPARWLEAMHDHKATACGAPNFAYDLCVRKTTPAQRAAWDLSRLKLVFNGSEPVRAGTLRRFAEAFAVSGYRPAAHHPCYGLAENTCIVSGGNAEIEPPTLRVRGAALEQGVVELAPASETQGVTELVSCGHTVLDTELLIVAPTERVRLGEDVIGELWVRSPSSGAGFWSRELLSEQVFKAQLADDDERVPYLRTGDLAFMHDGELYIAGRLKDLIIIRGRNIYPQDIESAAEEAHSALRPGCGAAFSIDASGEEQLVVVHELDTRQPVDPDEVVSTIRHEIAARFGVHVYSVVLVYPRTIPKTSSGKIQRRACREAYLRRKLDMLANSVLESAPGVRWAGPAPTREVVLALPYAERLGVMTEYLRAQIAQMLSVDVGAVDVGKPLIDLGMDSVLAADLESLCAAQLDAPVNLDQEYESVSARRLAKAVLSLWDEPGR